MQKKKKAGKRKGEKPGKVKVKVEALQSKMEKLEQRILLEKKNLKTKELGYAPIVKKIKKMIEEEVECY